MAMIHGGDTVLVRFFGARYSQTPFHSHLRIFEKRSMYRTSISFGIVVSLAVSLYLLRACIGHGITEQDTSRYERRGRAKKSLRFFNVS